MSGDPAAVWGQPAVLHRLMPPILFYGGEVTGRENNERDISR
jgi:hypothetical protein